MKRKTNLVKWSTVTLPKEDGGLGLKSMRNLNIAGLAKLRWRVMKDGTKTWSKMKTKKYMKVGASIANMKKKRNDSNAWKGICAVAPTLEAGARKVVRNGWETSFWMDCWTRDNPLRN